VLPEQDERVLDCPATTPERSAHRPGVCPRRILYVQPAEGFGGAERQGVVHIANLPRHGFEVVPVVGPGRPIVRALEDAGVRDYVFLDHLSHEADSPLDALGALRFWGGASLDWLATQRSLLRIARERRVELVFASRSTGWIAASPVARAMGLPFVWRTGSRMTHPAQPAALRLLASVSRPDLFLANCEAVRAQFAPLLAAPSRVLLNGVDTVRFDPARVAPRFRAELGIPAGVPVIGFPSRPAPEKGMDLLARVVELTARTLPDARFLIAGEFGWRRRYEGMYAAQGLDGRISFLGHVPDIESFLASCDVVVLTSKARSIEGSPNTLLEAMAMERPIVSTQVGGVAEAITDGVEGFLVEEGDAPAFAERLLRLLADGELRHRMGAAGRVRILAHHQDGEVTASLAAMLHDLLERRAERTAAERCLDGRT
jgi:glycosyltransferase involved in cell wall biosynthesis